MIANCGSPRHFACIVAAASLALLAACGSAPNDGKEGSILEEYLLAFGSEPEDEADREARKANIFGASGVAFSPDGRLVAVGTREMIWVADTHSGAVRARLDHQIAGYFGGRGSLIFVDEHRLAVGAVGAVLLWDLREYGVTDRVSLPVRMYSPRALAWSPATRTLAFSLGASNASVKLVTVEEEGFGELRDFPLFVGVPADLEFSRDGHYLAAAGDGAGVFIREVASGLEAGVLPTEGHVDELARFGEQELMVSGAGIRFWTFLPEAEADTLDNPDLQGQVSEQVVNRVVGGVAGGVALAALLPFAIFSGEGGSYAGLVAEFTSWFRENPVRTSPAAWCGRSTTITPDGRLLADVYPGITSEVIQVFDLGAGRVEKKLDPRGKNSCAALFSPDGGLLLVTTDKVARLYSTANWHYRDLELH